ncbi:MAG: FliI/YscN family ATPase [Planctomycetota bacterium]
MIGLAPELELSGLIEPLSIVGRVDEVRGMSVRVRAMSAPVGALVRIAAGSRGLGTGERLGEVVGVQGGGAMVMLFGAVEGIRRGDLVELLEPSPVARVGDRCLGRVVNGLGVPIDGGPAIAACSSRRLNPEPVGAMEREPVRTPMYTGLRAIDTMATMGQGQRLGIFAGPGVGKSTLLGMIARGSDADVNVIALIGERGREVREFIEESLGDEGLARSIVVVATGDESPLLRLRSARWACAAAEHFRDQGLRVMLMMDSVTRFAHAQRQVGLSVGEPPATKGYTPSVFAQLALLLERAGPGAGPGTGSITGLYTILVEGDDMTEPIADAARGILDGHLMLSRKLAQRAHFPAIDVLDSVSRVAESVSSPEHAAARRRVLSTLARYREIEDLVQIGAYAKGADPENDAAIEFREEIDVLLRQATDEREAFGGVLSRLLDLAQRVEQRLTQLRSER